MANSRLANFGTIFSRVTGLIETGALKDIPVWYNVYKKFPPDLEPRSDRPLPDQDPILEIVYEEDFDRIHKSKSIKKFVSVKATNESVGKNTETKKKSDVSKLLEHIIS